MFSFLRGKFLVGSMIGALALGMAFEADAKRMGGSRSMGKQSSSVTQQQQQRQQAPAQTQPTQQGTQQAAAPTAGAAGAAAATQRRGFMGGMGGILGGLAAGLGIAWLLSQFGLAGAAAEFLSNAIIIALVAFAAIWLIRKLRGGSRRQEPAYAGMARQAEPQSNPFAQQPQQPAAPAFQPAATAATAAPAAQQAWGVPADFDTDAFLRNAKVYFVRLQASWDAANLNDIREFTTPEMFAEIKMDLAERGQSTNQTDVVTLDAELLGIENQADTYLASVRFSGMIRENTGAAAEPFNEVWNLSKPAQGEGGWVLAGIQQVN